MVIKQLKRENSNSEKTVFSSKIMDCKHVISFLLATTVNVVNGESGVISTFLLATTVNMITADPGVTHSEERQEVEDFTNTRYETTTKINDNLEVTTNKYKKLDTTTNKYEHLEVTTNKYKHMDAATNKYEHLDASTIKYEPLKVSTNKYDHLDATTNKNEILDVTKNKYEHLDTATQKLEQSYTTKEKSDDSHTRSDTHNFDEDLKERHTNENIGNERNNEETFIEDNDNPNSMTEESKHEHVMRNNFNEDIIKDEVKCFHNDSQKCGHLCRAWTKNTCGNFTRYRVTAKQTCHQDSCSCCCGPVTCLNEADVMNKLLNNNIFNNCHNCSFWPRIGDNNEDLVIKLKEKLYGICKEGQEIFQSDCSSLGGTYSCLKTAKCSGILCRGCIRRECWSQGKNLFDVSLHSIPKQSTDIPNNHDDRPNYSDEQLNHSENTRSPLKDMPNHLGDVPNYSGDIPNHSRDIPNHLGDIPNHSGHMPPYQHGQTTLNIVPSKVFPQFGSKGATKVDAGPSFNKSCFRWDYILQKRYTCRIGDNLPKNQILERIRKLSSDGKNINNKNNAYVRTKLEQEKRRKRRRMRNIKKKI